MKLALAVCAGVVLFGAVAAVAAEEGGKASQRTKIQLSVGLEDTADLIADLEQGLKSA
jgi:cystathionine beta-lyase/cystathionine gamma-synthase